MIKKHKAIITTLAISLTIMVVLICGVNNLSEDKKQQDLQRLEDALIRAAVNCYSVEGFYPAEVVYLEQHYGVIIDDDKYNIFYEVVGSNILPTINVYRKE